MTVQITRVSSPELFVGHDDDPRQVLRIELDRSTADGAFTVQVAGDGVSGTAEVAAGDGATLLEVPLEVAAALRTQYGTSVDATVTVVAGDRELAADSGQVTIAEPGWTMVMVSHFHYDPVWWNTQAAYTTGWDLLGADGTTRPVYTHNAFSLVDAHLKLALRDPAYCFVLAELDYLKPYFDTFPEHRAVLRRLIAEGRVEIIGGTYNEPNTNLTGAETTIRNIVYGVGYQRDILGGDPQNAWQLDVFGHDPQFPGYLAKAGLTGSAWARGPFHQWGPLRQAWSDPRSGSATVMQFHSEFEWISPSGDGVLTHYMPDHYGSGWELQHAPNVTAAGETAYELFARLKTVAATKNVLLPVGDDYSPPSTWITALHHDWADRYAWPKFVCGTTKQFMDRVRTELDESGRKPSPQSRDMNPIYTGKDVSYIDTKQAQRAAEVAAVDAEKLGTYAELLGLGRFAEASLDKVWRQLAYGAHHDAITGSESDQVYIDLLTGWREAHDLSDAARSAALEAFAARIDTSTFGSDVVVVTNTLSFTRTDLVSVPVEGDVRVLTADGVELPSVVEGGRLTFLAEDVPSLGWRTYQLTAGTAGSWGPADSADAVENEFFRVTVDPSRGGAVSSILEKRSGRQVLKGLGNELRVYEEYPDHPRFGEGPWHLTPSGPVVGSSEGPAKVLTQSGPLGSRVVSRGEVDGIAYESVITLYAGLDRVEFTTRILDHAQSDRLVRVKFPADVPGALPLSEVAGAVVGRGFGLIDVDSEQAPWTLDNPANTWFGLGSTARISLLDAEGNEVGTRPVAVAEIVVPDDTEPADVRDLVVALARVGVTATTSPAGGSRYGNLKVDSNLPDLRILVGNSPLTDSLLSKSTNGAAGAGAGAGVQARAGASTPGASGAEGAGAAAHFVPAETALGEVWQPNADVRGVRTISALVLPDAAAVERAVAELAEARISATVVGDGVVEEFVDATVALLTYGLPGFAVDATGALHASLLRSCSGWPAGIWIDPPRRSTPDGSSFQLQHWTHEFRYALTAGDGDWRAQHLPSRGQEFSSPLLAATTTAHDGLLPATHSLLQVSPERDVLVSTLKPAGNPIAHGSGTPSDPREGVTLRLIEATGLGATATITSAVPITGACHADLLEHRGAPLDVADGKLTVDLAGSAVDTFVLDVDTAEPAEPVILGRQAELAQPSYSRYWLHNRGPAQMGFLPVSLSISPTIARTAGKPFEVELVIANQYVDSVARGTLTLDLPPGWTSDQPDVQLELEPGGYVRHLAKVTPADSEPGQYFVAARVTTRTDELAGGAGVQAVEDVVTVFLGDSPELNATIGFALPPAEPPEHGSGAVEGEPGRPTGLTVTPSTEDLRLTPGTTQTLELTFANNTFSEIRAELQLASPYGTWSWLPEPVQAVVVPPRSSMVVPVPVVAPADATPAHAWVLPKVMWFGRAQYAPTVRLEIS
ncbi:glycosyl hydrolase family 38 [Kribbella voronezhensis]|uniref:Glycosyl hydrolase family 38 n=1 Tax=Kribbella voronezhensis TaxID=2512212 RepID=A0A4R7T604_9ACTN|nr:glycoside hydrolase family 38 C-terminal domain-containing protein [Kribbella voronezhensis]TDU87300.1 glycosyl hydrolase family 38 [Kribbella voronezhensis]